MAQSFQNWLAEGENGHLLPSEDADAFAAAVLRYRADRQALARASASAARHVAGAFSWRAVADQYVRILQATAGGAAASPLARRAAAR